MKTSIALFALAAATPAFAQVPTLPTNAPGVRVVAPPPAGFNALTAPAAERQKYAIPPAPDASVNPAAFAEWQRAVGAPQSGGGAPTVTQTKIINGPVKLVGGLGNGAQVSQARASVLPALSSNWSGAAFYDSKAKFKTSAIIGEFTVPTARQAFGKCDGGYDYSSSWVGIDGFGSGDVFQAGIEADAFCGGSATAAFYSSWIEWYPFSEARVSAPALAPGDIVFVELWNVSPTLGYAYLYNFSSRIGATYQLTAPSGTTLVGSSAEWIVERPSVGGGLATLTNYLYSVWPYNIAWTYAAAKPEFFYPGLPVGGTTSLYSITMEDNAGGNISSTSMENNDFLFFRNFGSSLGAGTEPYGNGPAAQK